MIDNIRYTLYPKIGNKTQFFIELALIVGKSPLTLRQHWFANFWSIPEQYQERVVEFMQNYIKLQPA